jgi:exodeoxyribonuclease VII large subunit
MCTLPESKIWQVSELSLASRVLLEQTFGVVTVTGEVSGFTKARSGHWYFNLKDADGQVRCAMFRNRNLYSRYTPLDGDHINLRAKLSIYPQRGEYQLVGEHLEPVGLGALFQSYLQLKQQLEQEGLFDPKHKRGLPYFCQQLAVVTSVDGAAIHDILTVLRQRMRMIMVDVLPVPVQGPDAATAIIKSLQLVDKLKHHDAIIISRGGGSMEDLWSFNDPCLARAIHVCSIPVISAVGHETDFTIADWVADVRGATPSVAAQLVSMNQIDLLHHLQKFQNQLQQAWQQYQAQRRLFLTGLSSRLRHPRQRVHDYFQWLDSLQQRLSQSSKSLLDHHQHRNSQMKNKLLVQHPKHRIQALQQQLQQQQRQLQEAFMRHIQACVQQLRVQSSQLHQLSPLNTFARGYTIAMDSNGLAMRSIKQLQVHDELVLRMIDGKVAVQVTELSSNFNIESYS